MAISSLLKETILRRNPFPVYSTSFTSWFWVSWAESKLSAEIMSSSVGVSGATSIKGSATVISTVNWPCDTNLAITPSTNAFLFPIRKVNPLASATPLFAFSKALSISEALSGNKPNNALRTWLRLVKLSKFLKANLINSEICILFSSGSVSWFEAISFKSLSTWLYWLKITWSISGVTPGMFSTGTGVGTGVETEAGVEEGGAKLLTTGAVNLASIAALFISIIFALVLVTSKPATDLP